MPIRPIIEIDEELCDGCGDCIVACEENALAIVNGKAKLIREPSCDGFGACIGHCPKGALQLVERLAPDFVDPHGEPVSTTAPAPVPALSQPIPALPGGGGGCPGRMQMNLPQAAPNLDTPVSAGNSALAQWPVQLHLLSPQAPFLKGKELLLMADCAPVATPGVHAKLMQNRALAIACPKLDNPQGYVEKLTTILADPSIPRILVAVMEVPCCGGLLQMAKQAVNACGREDLEMAAVVVKLDGTMMDVAL